MEDNFGKKEKNKPKSYLHRATQNPLFNFEMTQNEVVFHSIDERSPGRFVACFRINGAQGQQFLYHSHNNIEQLLGKVGRVRSSIASEISNPSTRKERLLHLEKVGNALLTARNTLSMA